MNDLTSTLKSMGLAQITKELRDAEESDIRDLTAIEMERVSTFSYRAPLALDDACRVCGRKQIDCAGHAQERL